MLQCGLFFSHFGGYLLLFSLVVNRFPWGTEAGEGEVGAVVL
ncbi:hypothetical protein SAMN05216215_1018152 [Saccharopolyspora shandongensis]|uniref:Uncharacterized protein n=1 Tax=Saccharopolyspora shandongensis TaxID=418495 RepID=A0A1H3GF17_9PSEU|nr:hypothetical protein SAMN05216215_1018152 [Saccharopolyspora shandongensis]